MDVTITKVESTLVAALEHLGAPALVNDTARRFIEWRKATGLSPVASSQTYGVVYNNPDTTPPEEFRFDICGSVTEAVPDNPWGVMTKTIPGGRLAVLRHVGSHERLGESVYFLYREWLPGSSAEPRDFPVYFHYLTLVPDTPEHEHQTDVCLPIT